jgi:hypothetical protein
LSTVERETQHIVGKLFVKTYVGVRLVCHRMVHSARGESERMRFLSYLISPRQAVERERQQRERELYAAFARGRKRRWQRATLNKK